MTTLKEVCAFILTASKSDLEALHVVFSMALGPVIEKQPTKKSQKIDPGDRFSKQHNTNLETLRKSIGWTRQRLSDECNVSTQTIFNAERHPDKVSDETVEELRECLQSQVVKK
jgi:DNA-binding XRE family transcriptional regulator